MGIFKAKKEEKREIEEKEEVSADLLRALLDDSVINRRTILSVPSISACVNKIADTVASLDVKLYKRNGDRVEEVEDDRTRMLNDETGDTLTGYQLKKAMVEDMYLSKGGYAYIHKRDGIVKSLHYIRPEDVTFISNSDPIFKDYKAYINERKVEGFQLIKLLRNTKNGWKGTSIIEDSKVLMSVLYESQKYEENLVKSGGNKRGFLSTKGRMSEKAFEKLKQAFKRLYSNNTANVIYLNEGAEFKEASNTSVEMQLNENKHTNNDDVCKVFLVPPSIINGGASETDKQQYYEACVFPVLNNFAKSINAVLLDETEKSEYFFAFDVSELLKGDTEKRYRAYEIALKNGFMQVDEIRKAEKMPSFDLKFIKLGLQDVLYYPEKDEIYTPNTNKLSKMGTNPITDINAMSEGGGSNENRTKE